MAFEFLRSLTQGPRSADISSPVDDFEGDLDESDVELDFEDDEDVRSTIVGDTEHEVLPDTSDSDGESGSDEDLDIGTETSEWSADLHQVEIDLFTSNVGPNLARLDLDYQSEPIDFFHLCFPETLITIITTQTNIYAQQQNATNFTPVTEGDIKTFLYVNMMFGLHKLPAYTLFWSLDPLFRVPCVADVMSRNRYQDISRYLHLADNTDMLPRGQEGYDPLFKIRPAITAVQSACNSLFSPGVALSFDEAMIPFRGRLSFKQYIRGKPHPWGVKVWCVCDSATSFLLDFDFYTGKNNNTTTAMPHGLGYHVIWKLGQPFLRKKHHFYFDNYFSSVKLANDLLSQETYSCATIRQNRKQWPKDLTGRIAKGQCTFRQMGNLVACWWRDKRAVSMISTNASPVLGTASRRTKDGPIDKEIPESVLVYNANMGGVDRMDQLRSYYPIGRKSHKWWRCCLWFLMESAVHNAYILYLNMPRPVNSKSLSHLQFHTEIARSLMKGSSRKRCHREVPTAAGLAVPGSSKDHRRIRLPGRKRQCFQCRQKDVRTQSNKRPETVFGCVLCNTHLCDELCFAQFHQQLN